ncbi:flagellar hook-basal body complex protein, partial [Clostridium sp. LY3-2]|uniref:flagellar hook-basal body complex protein n=1 Tax=Clostridium sp. LY3-2 TaxID=2942482 RepID=UPI00215249A6
TLDTSKKRITIDADLTNAGLDLKDLQDKINKELDRNGKTTAHVTSITGTPNAADVKNTIEISDGQDMTSPGKIELGGISIEVPKGSKYNGLKIEIGDVRASSLSANYDAGLNKITLSGDFVTAGGVAGKDLADEINKKLGLTGDDRFFAQGSYKGIDSLNSDPIEGGEDLKSPTGETKVNGMNITLKPGGSLNGYTFQIGTITKGTKTTADVDANSKVITLNGDFTSQGAVTNDSMKSAINKALKEAGINQFVDKIEGKPNVISNTESGETNGGTPVESLTDNGALEFVSGTGTVKSYDGELKTLKIPDKVVMPGTGEELRVKTFSIDKNGLITGTLEDGRVAALGQLAMASFKNPEGLTSLGKNLYSQSVNSGDAIVKSGLGTTGEDNSSGYGDSIQGMLEMSNVDLAEQFTDMITTTRSFQASGKMINTGDEILQDIINLKR